MWENNNPSWITSVQTVTKGNEVLKVSSIPSPVNILGCTLSTKVVQTHGFSQLWSLE